MNAFPNAVYPDKTKTFYHEKTIFISFLFFGLVAQSQTKIICNIKATAALQILFLKLTKRSRRCIV